MDLPAPLSCFSRGFARLTSSEQRNLRACANLCRAKNRSGHGRTGRSGCYGPVGKDPGQNSSMPFSDQSSFGDKNQVWNRRILGLPVGTGILMKAASGKG